VSKDAKFYVELKKKLKKDVPKMSFCKFGENVSLLSLRKWQGALMDFNIETLFI
jgi:hypothetical protein